MFRNKKKLVKTNSNDGVSLKKYRQLEQIFEFAGDGIILTDKKGVLLEVNPAFCEITGLNKSEVVGKHSIVLAKKFVKIKDLPKILDILKNAFSGKKIDTYQLEFNNKNLEIKSPVKKFSNGLVGIIRDITERIESEKLIKESRSKLENVIEHINEMFYVHNRDNLLTYVSPQCNQILGYTQEEMMIKWTELATDNPINQQGEEITRKAFETGEKQSSYLLELVKKDSQKIWVEVDESPIKNDKGEVVEMVGVVRNITEKKLAEERIKSEHDEILRYLNLAGVMFLTLDIQGKVTMINKKGLSILGLEEKDVLGKDWFELAVPRENIKEIKGVFDKLMEKEIELIEFYDNEVVTSKNERRMIAWHNAIIINENGEIEGFLSSGEDVTEKRKKEKEMKDKTIDLEKMNKLMVGREIKMAEIKKTIQQTQDPTLKDKQNEVGENIVSKIPANDNKQKNTQSNVNNTEEKHGRE